MFTETITDNVQKVYEVGLANNMTFTKPDLTKWNLTPFDYSDFTIETEGVRRVNLILKAGIPIEEIYIGHEVETETEVKPKVAPTITIPDIPWKEVATVVGIILVGIGVIFSVLAFGAFCVEDPSVIIRVDGQYILLYAWLEVKNENGSG